MANIDQIVTSRITNFEFGKDTSEKSRPILATSGVYVAEDSPVRVVDVSIDDLDISGLGFRTKPNTTGRPSYHPKMMLKLYVYGYLNQVQSSRRRPLETATQGSQSCTE